MTPCPVCQGPVIPAGPNIIKIYCSKPCSRLAQRRREKGDPNFIPASIGRPKSDILTQKIIGPLPKPDEKAIYFLRRIGGQSAFYVGSTSLPRSRLVAHHGKFGGDVEMVIIRICTESEAMYWEAKLIVSLFEQGIVLANGYQGKPLGAKDQF